MIEIKETLGLAVAHHVAAFRIGAADLGSLLDGLTPLLFQRHLAVREPVLLDGGIERVLVIGARLRNGRQIELGPVGAGLEMG